MCFNFVIDPTVVLENLLFKYHHSVFCHYIYDMSVLLVDHHRFYHYVKLNCKKINPAKEIGVMSIYYSRLGKD